jgi:hypothetical protein
MNQGGPQEKLCDSEVLRQELKIHFIYSAGQLLSLGKLWKFTLVQAIFSADRRHGLANANAVNAVRLTSTHS